jgi:hypothetical protein
MLHPKPNIKETLLLNLYLFYILYFALILTEKQLIRAGLFGFVLPIKIGLYEIFIGFTIGTGLITILSMVLIRYQHIIRIFLLVLLVGFTISINYYLYTELTYPPYALVQKGSLNQLAEKRWNRSLPYDLAWDISETYPLARLHINPSIVNYSQLQKISRFGVYIIQSNEILNDLSDELYYILEDKTNSEYSKYQNGGIEYRLYNTDPKNNALFLTSYNNIIIIAPLSLLD